MKPTLAIQMLRNMGLRYTGYRIFHEFEKRTGVLLRKHPTNPEEKFFLDLDTWRQTDFNFVIPPREESTTERNPSESLKSKKEKILEGQVCFFSNEWKELGRNYNWVTNPMTGFKYDITKHWSQINDFDPENGDIKDVWEKSRFTYLLSVLRYDHHFEEDHSEFVFSEIESWIAHNPINQGPNWKCSQEISLRLFNWSYALAFYKNSAALTEERWKKIQHVIYWSLHHVYQHINFSRIAVRNNHAITETLCLAVSEILFPFIPETQKWARKGRKWFEQEIACQVYEDGTFLQFSMNYHRVVIQLLSLGLSLTEKNHKPFSKTVHERAYKSVDFLYQCLQEENGYLPNYGNNDGALFFQLTEMDYRDYRPQLNTLHHMLTGQELYTGKNLSEDSTWVFNENFAASLFPPLQKKYGPLSFPIGGFYLLREKDTFTFIRCGNHKDRPAQADNLHLDIWYKGENVLRDSGTYKYNTKNEFQEYFSGTAGHNTVMIGKHSQMLKGSRFMWFYWTQANFLGWEELEGKYTFKGEISAFRYLNPDITHNRNVVKYKNASHWEVTDKIKECDDDICFQNWHIDDEFTEIKITNKEIDPTQIPSYVSSFYGEMREAKGITFPFTKELTTTIKI